MWTDPELFKQWYGPKNFSTPVAEMDVRVGGRHLFCMEGETPRGPMKMCSTGEYTEVVPKTRLAYTDSHCDADGNVISPAAMGMPNMPETTLVTVELEDLGDRTKMVLTHEGVPPGAGGGWEQAFEKMAALASEG